MATPAMLRGVQVGTRSGGVLFGRTTGAQVFWEDSWLKQIGIQSFRAAGIKTKRVAQVKAPARRVARSISVSFFSGGMATGMNVAGILRASSPLAHLFEKGTKRHVIPPANYKGAARALSGARPRSFSKRRGYSGKVALKFPDGGFSRAPVPHPGMGARPFMRPAAALFPGLFRDELRRRF